MEGGDSAVHEVLQRTKRIHRHNRSRGQHEPPRLALGHPQRYVRLGPIAEHDDELELYTYVNHAERHQRLAAQRMKRIVDRNGWPLSSV